MKNIRILKNVRFLALSGMIAALYTAITLSLAYISFGQVQLRVAEAFTILPLFTPAAIPGLFLGCLLSNILGGFGALDIVLGPLATLLAALLTRALRRRPLVAMLPPVLINAVVVGIMLHLVEGLPLLITMLWVGLGQIGACYGLGFVLFASLKRLPALTKLLEESRF